MRWGMEPDIAARARRNGGKAERTRELLVNAAVAVAARDGLMALSFESIGRRAGMSPSGVAHRLGTLEKARAAVLEEVERRLKEGVLAKAQGSGAPRIWNACVGFLEAYEAVPLFTDVFSAVVPPELTDDEAHCRRGATRLMSLWRRFLDEETKNAACSRPSEVALQVLGLLASMPWLSRHVGIRRAREQVARSVASYLSRVTNLPLTELDCVLARFEWLLAPNDAIASKFDRDTPPQRLY